MTTFVGDEITPALERLGEHDVIGAVGVRALLRELGVDPGQRRPGELGPPQKTRQLNRRGRTLTITTSLLVQGSCGISGRALGWADPWSRARRAFVVQLARLLDVSPAVD